MKHSAKSNGGPVDGCNIDTFLKFLAREWTSHIVWALARNDTMRFGALRRTLPGGVSARLLSMRLKELETHGLVTRRDTGRLPLHVEYSLTEDGRRLDQALRRSEPFAGRLKKKSANPSKSEAHSSRESENEMERLRPQTHQR